MAKQIKHGPEFTNDAKRDHYFTVIVLGSFFVVGILFGFLIFMALNNEGIITK